MSAPSFFSRALSYLSVFLLPGLLPAAVLVSWGPADDIVSSSPNMSVGRGSLSVDLNTYSSPSGAGYYANDAGKTPDFYAATVAEVTTTSTTTTPNPNFRISDASPNDQIFLAVNGPVDTDSSFLQGIVLWKRNDFLNGADTSSFSMTGMTATLSTNGGSLSSRWVVQSGGNFYASALDAGNNSPSFASNPESVSWIDYDPTVDFTDFTGAAAGLVAADFDDLEAVGLYVEEGKGRFNQVRIVAFEVTGDVTVIPEPSAFLGLLTGFLVLMSVRRRS